MHTHSSIPWMHSCVGGRRGSTAQQCTLCVLHSSVPSLLDMPALLYVITKYLRGRNDIVRLVWEVYTAHGYGRRLTVSTRLGKRLGATIRAFYGREMLDVSVAKTNII